MQSAWGFFNIIFWNNHTKGLFGWYKRKFDFSELIWDSRYIPTLALKLSVKDFKHLKSLDWSSHVWTSWVNISLMASFSSSLRVLFASIKSLITNPEINKNKTTLKQLFAEVLVVNKVFITALIHHPPDTAEQIGLWKSGQNYGIILFKQFIVKTTLKCPTIFPSDKCANIIDTQYIVLKLFVLLFRPTS